MGHTAEIDGNEINLAQMWSLFCLWGLETSLQSFKFPCNLEIKEISICVYLACQWPSMATPSPHYGITEQSNKCEISVWWDVSEFCLNSTCSKWKDPLRQHGFSFPFVTGRLSDWKLWAGQEGLLTSLGLLCCFPPSGWPVGGVSKQHYDGHTKKVIRNVTSKPQSCVFSFSCQGSPCKIISNQNHKEHIFQGHQNYKERIFQGLQLDQFLLESGKTVRQICEGFGTKMSSGSSQSRKREHSLETCETE